MRKAVVWSVLAALAAAGLAMPVMAADPEVKIHGEVTTREEYLENFTDLNDDDTAGDNLDFGFYRARLGASVDVGDGISGLVEVQSFGTWGQNFPLASNPGDPVIGGVQTNDVGDSNGVDLYQANVTWKEIGGTGITATLGRQEHVLGNELMMGDNDWYGGQAFDGLRVNFGIGEKHRIDVWHYWVQERSVLPGSLGAIDDGNAPQPFANDGSDDWTLTGASFAFTVGDGHEIEPYFILSHNGNEADIVVPKHSVMTLGALYDRPMSHASKFDWSLEVAAQQGDFYHTATADNCPGVTVVGDDCDQSGMAAEGWFGYTFGDEAASHHRIHIGALMLSQGDDTEDVETFFALFPDTHGRAGLADVFSNTSTAGGSAGTSTFTNLTDIYAGWQWWGGSQTFGVTLHQFACTEDAAGFGCPTADEDDLGQEVDLWYQYDHGEHLSLQAGIADFMAGDTFDDPITGDSADDALRIWGQAKFRM